jgi:hypothetical protein
MGGNKRITLDKLARMVKEGFDQTAWKADMARGFADVNTRLDGVGTRLDRIENLLLQDHLNRIERLEDSVRVLKTKTGVA